MVTCTETRMDCLLVAAPHECFEGASLVGIGKKILAWLADGGVNDVDEGKKQQRDAQNVQDLAKHVSNPSFISRNNNLTSKPIKFYILQF